MKKIELPLNIAGIQSYVVYWVSSTREQTKYFCNPTEQFRHTMCIGIFNCIIAVQAIPLAS